MKSCNSDCHALSDHRTKYYISTKGDWLFPGHFTCSYFEKGCRKKCTRQPRKALWVVLSSLFFKEIWKNWHERPWKCVFECYRKATKVRSTAKVVRNSVSIISHITFRDCRVHIFPTTFLEIAVYGDMISFLMIRRHSRSRPFAYFLSLPYFVAHRLLQIR